MYHNLNNNNHHHRYLAERYWNTAAQ